MHVCDKPHISITLNASNSQYAWHYTHNIIIYTVHMCLLFDLQWDALIVNLFVWSFITQRTCFSLELARKTHVYLWSMLFVCFFVRRFVVLIFYKRNLRLLRICYELTNGFVKFSTMNEPFTQIYGENLIFESIFDWTLGFYQFWKMWKSRYNL